ASAAAHGPLHDKAEELDRHRGHAVTPIGAVPAAGVAAIAALEVILRGKYELCALEVVVNSFDKGLERRPGHGTRVTAGCVFGRTRCPLTRHSVALPAPRRCSRCSRRGATAATPPSPTRPTPSLTPRRRLPRPPPERAHRRCQALAASTPRVPRTRV